ncbi:MAG: hypothetical protein E7269_05220 [Lachnospiraceae bacterium]|nr:hypothetical protein [Lachnospiraceae bacterium]
MILQTITDTKQLMSDLLIKDTFHDFLVREVTIVTYCTLHLDGTMLADFYDNGEYEELGFPECASWDKLKPLCFSFIKGKKLPLKMQLVFHAPQSIVDALLAGEAAGFAADDIHSLTFTVKYEKGKATVLSGLSLKIFTIDQTLAHAWDCYVNKLFSPYL